MKWEYKVINTLHEGVPLAPIKCPHCDSTDRACDTCVGEPLDYATRFAMGLNILGDDSWEMCASPSSTLLVFKRQRRR